MSKVNSAGASSVRAVIEAEIALAESWLAALKAALEKLFPEVPVLHTEPWRALVALRQKKGEPVSKIAAEVGVHGVTLADWIKGNTAPGPRGKRLLQAWLEKEAS